MTTKKPPVRQDPMTMATPTPIEPEIEAQQEVRTERRRAERKKARPKATYDLPASLIEQVQKIASREDIAQSDVVAWAIIELIDRYRAGQVDWRGHKRPARSLRVTWKLELPEKWRK